MKKHRILGILWFAFCCDACFDLVRAMQPLHLTAADGWIPWCVFAVFFLVYLTGIVASIFLFRGERWSRWVVGLIAIFAVLSNAAYIVSSKSPHAWSSVTCVFALASLVLLFLPRHEPVA